MRPDAWVESPLEPPGAALAFGWRSSDSETDRFAHSRRASKMEGLHQDDQLHGPFLAARTASDPSVLVGDHGRDLYLAKGPQNDELRHWPNQTYQKYPLQNHLPSSPRLRHAFPLDTSASSLTLPLYSPGHSPSPSPKPYKHTLVGNNTFLSPIVSGLVHRYPSLSRHTQLAWLLLYFSFNLLLTLSNKSVLIGFPFPYTLTALHALFSTAGGLWMRWQGLYTHKRLSRRHELILAGFSVLYAVNIAVSNLSLNLVTVPFHQVVRAVTPIFTIMLSGIFFDAQFGRQKILSLAPIILGVALATYGDYYFTAWGFCLTLLGTFLASLKTIFTNVLQSSPTRSRSPSQPERRTFSIRIGHLASESSVVSSIRRVLPPSLELHPLDLLARMSPLAFVQCVMYAQFSGELNRVRQFHAGQLSDLTLHAGIGYTKILALILNGCIAFGLNVVSFAANGKVGPLSMTVAGNVKQVLTIVFAVSLFDLTITPMNALGIGVTLLGGAWYAWEEYATKTRKARGS